MTETTLASPDHSSTRGSRRSFVDVNSNGASSAGWSPRAALVVLILVLVFGAYARVIDLGKEELWNDELLHVFTAQSLARGEGPRLPSGELYTKGIDVSRLVRISQQHVADPEAGARLPSAILGIVGLVIFAAIAWRIAGPWPAVWAALLLGIFPTAVQESRNTRFYTEQLALGLVAMYAGWRALEQRPERSVEPASPGPSSRWGWVSLTLLAFFVAARVQFTTLSVVAGWAGALTLFAVLDSRRLGRSALRQSVPVQLAVVGILGLVALAVARPELPRRLMNVALNVPFWAREQFSPKAYYWMLSESLPLVVSLLPLVFLAVLRRSWALAAYLFFWFSVPLALHSFVFRFQAERYVLLAMPALFLAVAIAAADACGGLLRMITDWMGSAPGLFPPRAARYLAAGAVGVVAATAVVTTPAFVQTRKVAAGQLQMHAGTNWRRALEVLRATPGADSLPWGSRQAVPPRYYWGRIDFATGHGLLERLSGGPETTGPRLLRLHPEGTRDFYVGVPVLSTVDAIRNRFGAGRDVIIAIDTMIETGSDADLARALRHSTSARELCAGRCGSIRLYRWTLPSSSGRGE